MTEIKRNEWYKTQVPKDNDVYNFLLETKEKSDAIFGVVLTALEVVETALDFATSFLTLVESPIIGVIKEIIEILEKFKRDLLNAGVYFTYDRKELPKALKKPHLLQGGYSSFENRIIDKLLNVQDPTRPIFTDESKVLAITLYSGGGIGSLARAIKSIMGFLGSFKGIGDSTLLPVSGVRASYYKLFDNDTKIELKSSDIDRDNKPQGVRVKWSLTPPKNPNPFFPSFTVPPNSFYINVSTRSKPLNAFLSKEQPNATGDVDTPRNISPVRISPNSNTPLNTDLIHVFIKADDEGVVNIEDSPVNGETGFLFLDRGVSLKSEDLEKENTSYFYNPSNAGTFFEGTDFELDIPISNLPTKVFNSDGESSNSDRLYISVFSTSAGRETNKTDYRDPEMILKSDGTFDLFDNFKISEPSKRIYIPTPSYIDSDYLSALKEALTYFILARLDLGNSQVDVPTNSPLNGVVNRKPFDNDNPFDDFIQRNNIVRFFKFRSIKDKIFPPEIFTSVTAEVFRNFIKHEVEKTMDLILDEVGMPTKEILNSLKPSIDFLNENKITPLLENEYEYTGLQPSINSIGSFIEDTDIDSKDIIDNGYQIPRDENTTNQNPILISYNLTEVQLEEEIENLTEFTQYGILEQASFIFNFRDFYNEHLPHVFSLLSATPNYPSLRGDWDFFRFFDGAIPSFDEFFNTLTRFFKDLEKSVDSIIKSIQKYVAMISKRVQEIQRIVKRIKEIIDLITSFRLPSDVSCLLTVSNGVGGLISDLRSSEGKPLSGSDIYGTGCQMVFGGLPSIMFDYLVALAGGPDLSDERN